MVPDPSGMVEENQDGGIFKLLQTDVRKPVKLEITNSKSEMANKLPCLPAGRNNQIPNCLNVGTLEFIWILEFGAWNFRIALSLEIKKSI